MPHKLSNHGNMILYSFYQMPHKLSNHGNMIQYSNRGTIAYIPSGFSSRVPNALIFLHTYIGETSM